MSDVMLFGVLRMPYEMAMSDELSRVQFYGRAQEAADRIEAQARRIEALEAELAQYRAPAASREPTTIVEDVMNAYRGAGFEVRDDLGAGHPFAVTGSLDSAALLLEAAMVFDLPIHEQETRDETYLFEHWARDPVRADKIPLAKHGNGAYSDMRSYLIRYGWNSRAKLHYALYKRPENLGPISNPSPEAKAAAYERLRLASALQQPAPVPDQMALVWRADLLRMRYDVIRLQAFFDHRMNSSAVPQSKQKGK